MSYSEARKAGVQPERGVPTTRLGRVGQRSWCSETLIILRVCKVTVQSITDQPTFLVLDSRSRKVNVVHTLAIVVQLESLGFNKVSTEGVESGHLAPEAQNWVHTRYPTDLSQNGTLHCVSHCNDESVRLRFLSISRRAKKRKSAA